MSTDFDFDRIARAWLADGPTELSGRVLDAVADDIHVVRQRHALSAPRRFQLMTTSHRLAIAAALVVAVGAAGLLYLGGHGAPAGGPSPAPTPSASASASAAAASVSAAPSLGVGVHASGTIVFELHDPTANANNIWSIAPDGTGKRELVAKDSCCLSLSPDGANILYATQTGTLVPNIADLDGANASTYQPIGGPTGLLLGPSGGWSSRLAIAFEGWSDTDPSKTGIYLSVDNGGALVWGDLKRLTTRPGALHDIPLAFSHDGSRLLFLRAHDQGAAGTPGPFGDLYVIGVDGSGLRRLSPTSTGIYGSDWAPAASWSPDDRQVAFSAFADPNVDGTSAVYVADPTTGDVTALTGSVLWTTSARWSSDGMWIAFNHIGSGTPTHHDLFLIHPDGTGIRTLVRPAGVGVCCAQWSPDGSYLLVQGSPSDETQSRLYAVKADGSGVATITNDAGEYTSYVWSPQAQRTP